MLSLKNEEMRKQFIYLSDPADGEGYRVAGRHGQSMNQYSGMTCLQMGFCFYRPTPGGKKTAKMARHKNITNGCLNSSRNHPDNTAKLNDVWQTPAEMES